MIIIYDLCVFRWSLNSVRFENLMGICFQKAKLYEILSHSLRYGMHGKSLSALWHMQTLGYRGK